MFLEFMGFHYQLLRRVLSKSRYWFTVKPKLSHSQVCSPSWAGSWYSSWKNEQNHGGLY